MTNKLLAAAVLLLAACADQAGPAVDTTSGSAPSYALTATARSVRPAVGTDVCSLLPADSGPCSLACKPALLSEQFIDPGSCAWYECTLSNGQTITAGGCRESHP